MSNKKMYPASFRPFMREDVQLVIEPSASYTEDVNPLSAPHEKYTRFNFSIISSEGVSSMNMRWFSDSPESANSYIEFRERAQIAKRMHLSAKESKKSTPAFSLMFPAGRDVKGKTCAQVLKENPDNGKEILTSQRNFLQQNLTKFRDNQKLIDAIDEALSLTQDQINKASESVTVVLFDSGLRAIANKKNANGKAFCYKGSIKFYPGAKSPLEVEIENCYCTLSKDDKGLNQIILKSGENITKGKINLNFGEALRLFAELEEYFTIKYDYLERIGIKKSEELIAAQRRERNSEASSREVQNTGEKPAQNVKATTEVNKSEAKYKIQANSPLTESEDGWMILKVLDASGKERTVWFGPKAIGRTGKRWGEFTDYLKKYPAAGITITAQEKGEVLQFVAF